MRTRVTFLPHLLAVICLLTTACSPATGSSPKTSVVGSSESAEIAPATIEFSTFTEPESGITFDYPTSLTPDFRSTKNRLASGIYVTRTQLHFEDENQSVFIHLWITENPPRGDDPSLWIPEDASDWSLFLIFELTHLQFIDSDQDREAFKEAVEAPTLVTIAGYPAAEYSVDLKNFPVLGEAILNGALLTTDTMEVHAIVVDVAKTTVEGSFTRAQVEHLWDQLLISLSIPEPNQQ